MRNRKRDANGRRADSASAFAGLVDILPQPWSAEELLRRIAARRARPIHLFSCPLSGDDPTGFWLTTSRADYIVIPDTATGARRDAIIGHELAHILLGHTPLPLADGALLSALVPDSPPELVARFLPRQGYSDDVEREAEQFATLLITHVHAERVGEVEPTELDRLSSRLR